MLKPSNWRRLQVTVKLLVATHNRGKLLEYATLLGDSDFELVSLADLVIDAVVEESGTSYAENALLKARAYAAATGMLTLADDSGLEVEALGGAPGVHTARYGGPSLSDGDRCRLLLQELVNAPDEHRAARFRCVIALVWPDGREGIVEGVCEGRIPHELRGTNGFGYDPLFLLPERGCTMAELPAEVKNRISHRARAAAAARRLLKESLG